MANKVKYGLRNVYYSVFEDGEYETPKALAGAVALNLSRVGDIVKFWADDVEYFVSDTNNGYEGTLEVALATDDFKVDVLGMQTDSNGAIIESADDKPKQFALGFEVQGDDKPRRVWYYNCTCARPDDNAGTKEDTKTPQTDTLAISMTPRTTDRKVKAVMTKTAQNESAFNAFFTEVYESPTSI